MKQVGQIHEIDRLRAVRDDDTAEFLETWAQWWNFTEGI